MRVRPLVWPSGNRLVVGALLATFAAGCASEVDLSSLRKEQRDLARRLADTRADVESLRVQVSRLRGQVEDGNTRSRPSSSTTATTDIEERLRVLESGSSSRPTDPAMGGAPPSGAVPPGSEFGSVVPPPASPPPPTAPPETTSAPASLDLDMGRSTNEEYRAGLTQLQRGDAPKAVQTLRGYVNRNPKSDVVPYAQFWIGEAYYGQGKFNEAILAYNEVLVGSPKSDRVPAALLRQASAFAELGDKIDARLILQKLIAEHPNSPEAARAKRQLMALGS